MLDAEGSLHFEGQDLGPGASSVSDDGEYEWATIYAVEDIPAVVALLGGEPGDDILDLLATWTGERAGELERRLRESGLPVKRSTWS